LAASIFKLESTTVFGKLAHPWGKTVFNLGLILPGAVLSALLYVSILYRLTCFSTPPLNRLGYGLWSLTWAVWLPKTLVYQVWVRVVASLLLVVNWVPELLVVLKLGRKPIRSHFDWHMKRLNSIVKLKDFLVSFDLLVVFDCWHGFNHTS